MDRQHINVISLSNDVDNKTLEARIIIDNFLLEKDSSVFKQLKSTLDSIEIELEKLNLIFVEEFRKIDNEDLENFNKEYKVISSKLSLFKNYINNRVSEEKLLGLYANFYASYRQFGQFLNRYLYDNADVYEKEIWVLLFILFLLIVAAGSLIIRLINKLIASDRNLVKKTIEVENRERKRIAADLHDEVGAYLSSLIMYVEVLEQECNGNQDLKDKIATVNKLSRQAIQSTEAIVNNLNPAYLSRLGLAETLNKTVDRINSLHKTQVLIDLAGLNSQLAKSLEITVYRICTELINNALKHSSAKNAKITLYSQRKKIYLLYEDNGVGFKQAELDYENNKSGLYNLAAKVRSLDGSFVVNSAPGQGVKINIVLNIN